MSTLSRISHNIEATRVEQEAVKESLIVPTRVQSVPPLDDAPIVELCGQMGRVMP